MLNGLRVRDPPPSSPSMASVSSTGPQPPSLDLVAIGKTTRKTLERLASFSRMQSSSTANPLLTTILDKINTLIRLIDSSMLVAQYGYQLSTEALIYCDTDTADWDADVSIERLREISGGALELSKKVAEGFRDIKQDVYKIAASTKDDMFIVLVPPDPTHSGTLKIHLKEVGADLVANLSLLSDYSRSMTTLTEWCQYVANDLASDTPSLLPPSQSDADYIPAVLNDTDIQTAPQRLTALWSEMKDGFQEYYNVINVAHLRFPELLGSSTAAWRSVALARSHAPSPAPASQLGHYTTGSSTGLHTSSSRGPVQRKPGLGAVLSVIQRGKGLFERRKQPPRVTVVHPQDKGKERELSDSIRVIPPSVGRSPSSDASSPSRYSEPSEHTPQSLARGDAPEPRVQNKLLPFSCCCPINIFQDAVALLGNHGCMTK